MASFWWWPSGRVPEIPAQQLQGGILAWQAAGLPVAGEPVAPAGASN